MLRQLAYGTSPADIGYGLLFHEVNLRENDELPESGQVVSHCSSPDPVGLHVPRPGKPKYSAWP